MLTLLLSLLLYRTEYFRWVRLKNFVWRLFSIGYSSLLSLKLGEILLRPLHVFLHGFIPRFPARRADFIRVRLHVLNRLQRSQRFIDGATERRIVNGRVLNDTFLVDDKQTSQRLATVFIVHIVCVNRLTLQVREQRVFDVA